MKKKVALIYGGSSTEFEVSVKSGENVAGTIDPNLFEVHRILFKGSDWRVLPENTLIDKTDFSYSNNSGEKVTFDIALIMIHGTPGENGLLQGYFDMIGLPYTTCNAFVSALTFDKYACKCFLRDTGVRLAKEVFLRSPGEISPEKIIKKLGLPLFVKPNDGGSSFGVTKVKKTEELLPAIENAFKAGTSVLIEEFISGREFNNGVFEKEGETVRLPVIEIITDREFFDYEAKYLGASREVCPAEIADELSNRIIDTTHKIYRYLGCSGVVRVDYILHEDEIYFLEINTVPGMTDASLVPQQVRHTGMSMTTFWTILLSSALKK